MKRLTAALPAAVLAAGTLAACTTSGHGSEAPAVTTPAAITSPSVPPTSSSVAPRPTTSHAAPSTSSHARPSSSAASSTATSVVQRSTCRSLTIRVLRGGAINGREVAGLQFTNSGASSCLLVGYPTVTLLRAGKQIGQTSQPSTTATSRRTLAPGDVAESRLLDYTSNCQAPLSDSIQVVAPGSSITQVRPQFEMRGCILRTDPLGPPE